MTRCPAPAFALVSLGAAAAIAAGGPPAALDLHGLKLTPPIPFSRPARAGLDALVVRHPAEAKPGGEKMSLTAVAFAKDSGMSDAELLDYVKTTFLATSAPGRPVARTFVGARVAGQALVKKIPAPAGAEVYVLTKKNGAKVVLAFVFASGFAPQAEKVITAIAATLKE